MSETTEAKSAKPDLVAAANHMNAVLAQVAKHFGPGIGAILIIWRDGEPTACNTSSNGSVEETLTALASSSADIHSEAVRRGLLTTH